MAEKAIENKIRLDLFYCPGGGQFCLWYWPNKFCSKNFLGEINACTYVLILLGVFCMNFQISCLPNKSSYFLQITLYAEHARSDVHPSLRFHCIPCQSSYSSDNAMVIPQYLICVSRFEKVYGLSKGQCSWE